MTCQWRPGGTDLSMRRPSIRIREAGSAAATAPFLKTHDLVAGMCRRRTVTTSLSPRVSSSCSSVSVSVGRSAATGGRVVMSSIASRCSTIRSAVTVMQTAFLRYSSKCCISASSKAPTEAGAIHDGGGDMTPEKEKFATWAAYQAGARAALDKTDTVALRCWKAGKAFPADWAAYTEALRAIVKAESGDPTQPLPSPPDYPAGT